MKKIALVLIASFCAIASFSQIGKGNWEVGGSGHMTWSTQDFDGDKYHYNNFAISPRIGKFICEGFVLGLNLEFVSERYHINDDDPYKYNSFNTGLFARYYIGRNGQKHNIFAEGSFDFGGSKPSGQDERFNYNEFAFGVGVICWLNTHIGLYTALQYRSYNDESQDYYEGENVGRYNSFGLVAGFTLSLDPCKKKPVTTR